MTDKPTERERLVNLAAAVDAVANANKALLAIEAAEITQLAPHLYKVMPMLLKTKSRLQFHIAKIGVGKGAK